jgi:aspartate kinase
MMTADPRVVPLARVIDTISFDEASELAYFGARVLHPLTLAPAIEKGIPVRIRNSRQPDLPGTEVRSSAPPGSSGVRSIAYKNGITTVNIVTSRMLMAAGFLRTLFEVFARHETPVDMVTTSEVSVSVTVDDSRLERSGRNWKMRGSRRERPLHRLPGRPGPEVRPGRGEIFGPSSGSTSS